MNSVARPAVSELNSWHNCSYYGNDNDSDSAGITEITMIMPEYVMPWPYSRIMHTLCKCAVIHALMCVLLSARSAYTYIRYNKSA